MLLSCFKIFVDPVLYFAGPLYDLDSQVIWAPTLGLVLPTPSVSYYPGTPDTGSDTG